MQKYFIKWKGVESGPFSAEDLANMYNLGKIGLMHSIRGEDSAEWIFFRDFLDTGKVPIQNSAPVSQPNNKSIALQIISYIFCGASFISLIFYFCALLIACGYFFWGEKRAALILTLTSSLMAILGVAFFSILLPVINS